VVAGPAPLWANWVMTAASPPTPAAAWLSG